MEFKTPKVLERKPIVMGFDLKMVVIIIMCTMLFVFTMFINFFLSLIFLILMISYIMISKKYPGKGELITVIKYQSGMKCIHLNQSVTSLVQKRTIIK